ncbi:MAG TPA: hypothetical protein PKC59_10210 [Burkholderiaceae bacterium]|nr:hypothetical protein [Burkholderiaceae bacterium]
MNRLFLLTEAGRRKWRLRMLHETLVAIAAIEILGIGILFGIFQLECWHYIVMTTMAVIFLGIVAILFSIDPSAHLRDWGLMITERNVYLTDRSDAPQIPLGDLLRIQQKRHGVLLISRNDRIFVPDGVEDFLLLIESLRRSIGQ